MRNLDNEKDINLGYLTKSFSGNENNLKFLQKLVESLEESTTQSPTQSTNALLMFGPAHGCTMVIPNNTHGVLWQETWQETEPPIWLPVDYSKQQPIRRRTHTYRREDEYESSNMEECTIFVHDEKCCDARMPSDKRK